MLPNYRTADGSIPFQPISARQKFIIASKDSFDWPLLLLAGAYAGLAQLGDQHPSFGQGSRGCGKRLAAAYADQAGGNLLTEAAVAGLLHEDPRYFRRGSGSGSSRTGYALTRIFVTRTDAGGRRFNTSELLGNSISVALSNTYYADTRNVRDNVQKPGVQLATDAVSNVLKEFRPDFERRFLSRHSAQQ